MSSRTTSRGTSRWLPDHYEQTRIDGKEHPADVVINNLPGIIRFKRRLSKLSEELRQSVRDPKPFMAYVDTRGLYQSTRENLFFDAGFEHGLLAERQDCLAERMAMPTVTVTDVVVTTRKVKLPATCPGCGGRLRAEGALRVSGFVDESRKARLPRASDDAMDAVAGVVLGDAGYDSGETFIDNVSVMCSRCNRALAEGTFTVKPSK